MAVTAPQLLVRERLKRTARGQYTRSKKKVSHPVNHPHFKDIEKDEITPERVDPYTLHPDVYSVDTRGPMGTECIIYDADMKPIERIRAHDGRRERVPFTQRPVPEIPRPLTRAFARARTRLRKNAQQDAVLMAAYLPKGSPRIMGNLGPDPMEEIARRNVQLRRIIRDGNPGV